MKGWIRLKRWVVPVLAVGAILLAAGCSASQATVIEVTAKDMGFAPKEITVPKGKPVKVVFKNQDVVLHDLSVDEIAVKVKGGHSDGHDMGGKEPDLHVSADAGKIGEVEFTASKEGSYTFYCTVTGHKEAGMSATLVVK